MKKIFFAILLLVAAGVAVGLYLFMKPVADIQHLKPDYKIESTNLFSEFEMDEIAAGNKYIGKVIEVSGVVNDKFSDKSGQTIILDAGNEIFGINCGLNDDQKESYEKIKTGQMVTLRGSCSGYTMDVVLIRCVIVGN